MTKADIVDQVATAIGPGLSRNECALVVDGFLNAVKQALARGENIEIRRFGTFKVRERKPRRARNPRTGETVEVPARTVPVFKASDHFRRKVEQLRPAQGTSYSSRDKPYVTFSVPDSSTPARPG